MDWFLSGPEVDALELEEAEFYCKPIIPKEGIVFLYGKYGAFKTAIGLNIARTIVTSPRLWELPIENTKVLFVEGDMPRTGIIPRIKKLKVNVPNLDFAFIYPGMDVVNTHTPPENKDLIQALVKKQAENKYGLVIIDSLRSSHPLADKDSEAATLVYRQFASIFPGAVVFLIHHDKKTKPIEKHLVGTDIEEELEDESFSGSQAWINHATTSLKIKRHHGNDRNWIVVKQTKSQVGPIASALSLRVTDGIHVEMAQAITSEGIHRALHTVSWKNMRSLDGALAKFFDVSERWARDQRIKYEQEVGPIPRVGPLTDTK